MLDIDGADIDERLLAGWRSRVLRAREWLQWPGAAPEAAAGRTAVLGAPSRVSEAADRSASIVIRRHATGALLAIAAPCDQLFTATEVNEWAWCATLLESDPARYDWVEKALIEAARQATADAGADAGSPATAEEQASVSSTSPGVRVPISIAFASAPPVLGERAALARFAILSRIEAAPRLRTLVDAANSRGLLSVLDEDFLTLGSGATGRTWAIDALPDVKRVPWNELRNVPAALVTGSNGKTTTVRLLAAFAREHGWREGFNCTDGLFVAGEQIESGDYSGPVGTRTILRDKRVEAAILETARGGILRRGLAAGRADVAIVTNVSADHFGEYGIHDLEGLADVKLVVASAIDEDGLLVLNADDSILRERGLRARCPVGWFALDYDFPLLQVHRKAGGWTSGVRNGRLIVKAEQELDLGAIAEMPLTVDGTARYNVSNIAGAVLAASALGISDKAIESVLTHFGAQPTDNAGRLMRYPYRGAQVLVDYAHNPEGLSGLLEVGMRLRKSGRMALVLGQAGNRTNADIERLAVTAVAARPNFVVIKETENYLRGRAPGEVPAIIHAALRKAGLPESAIQTRDTELAAVNCALEWAQPGDVVVLPVHDRKARAEVMRLLSAK